MSIFRVCQRHPKGDILATDEKTGGAYAALCSGRAIRTLPFHFRATLSRRRVGSPDIRHSTKGTIIMSISISHLQPIVSLVAGVLILVIPRLLNYIVAAFLIVSGLLGLGLVR